MMLKSSIKTSILVKTSIITTDYLDHSPENHKVFQNIVVFFRRGVINGA